MEHLRTDQPKSFVVGNPCRGLLLFRAQLRCARYAKHNRGHGLSVSAVYKDCDAESLLVTALPTGPTCHTGAASCFGDGLAAAAARLSFLVELETIIASRIATPPEQSYTAALHAKGLKTMAQKVGEEGLEVALAVLVEPDQQIIGEAAELLFHLLVVLRARHLGLADVVTELVRRHSHTHDGRHTIAVAAR